MKFGKTFDSYLAERANADTHHVGVKSLKKILKHCRKVGCEECAARFFGQLMHNINDVLEDFTDHAKELIRKHRIVSKWALVVPSKYNHQNRQAFPENAVSLLAYVTMNHMAVRKMVKKFEKVHGTVNDDLKCCVLDVDRRLARSPLLIELTSLSVVLGRPIRATDFWVPIPSQSNDLGSADGVICDVGKESDENEDESTDTIVHGVRVIVTLTCCVCLDTLHNPTALTCGHVLCRVCACDAAGIPWAFRLKAAPPNSKCPLCRQEDAYRKGIPLNQLDSLIKSRNEQRWTERNMEIKKNLHKQRSEFWRREEERVMQNNGRARLV